MLRCGVERKGFEHLLRRPFRRWMSGDVEVHDASSIVCEDNKNEEDFEPNGVDGEEVDGRELRNMILEERPPRLRWWFRTMYLATEASEILMSNFISSLWIRGAPQIGFSRLMVRIKSRICSGTRGRPAFPCRTFQLQYQRNP